MNGFIGCKARDALFAMAAALLAAHAVTLAGRRWASADYPGDFAAPVASDVGPRVFFEYGQRCRDVHGYSYGADVYFWPTPPPTYVVLCTAANVGISPGDMSGHGGPRDGIPRP